MLACIPLWWFAGRRQSASTTNATLRSVVRASSRKTRASATRIGKLRLLISAMISTLRFEERECPVETRCLPQTRCLRPTYSANLCRLLCLFLTTTTQPVTQLVLCTDHPTKHARNNPRCIRGPYILRNCGGT